MLRARKELSASWFRDSKRYLTEYLTFAAGHVITLGTRAVYMLYRYCTRAVLGSIIIKFGKYFLSLLTNRPLQLVRFVAPFQTT